ncbi:MAG: hypothetical protein ABI675_09920 [Chitinophagaceae bacterium]
MQKYALVFLGLVISAISLIAQEKTREDYLRLAKSQKVIGIGLIVVGAGAVLLGASYGAKRDDPSFDVSYIGEQVALVLLGAGIVSIGVKTLINSGKNKRVGLALTFKNEPLYRIKNSSLVYQPMAAVSFRIRLQ